LDAAERSDVHDKHNRLSAHDGGLHNPRLPVWL